MKKFNEFHEYNEVFSIHDEIDYYKLLEGHIDWSEMEFRSAPEKEVADVAEETLSSKYLIVFSDKSPQHEKLKQHASSEQGKIVLETDGNNLTLFTVPCEFLRWDMEIEQEPLFIIRGEDYDKI